MALEINHYAIEGQGIRLEPLTLAHAEGLYAIGQEAGDWKYLPRPCFSNLDDTLSWIDEALQLKENQQHYTYVIIDVGNDQIMGSTRYLNITPRDYTLEIGYTFLGKDFQRTRINSTAKYLILKNAFETLSANRVELRTDARNTRSQQAIERLGAIKEGVLRKHRIVQHGFVRDTVVYSILADEWCLLKTRLIKNLQ